jgi:hypothetical protein
MKVGQVNWFLGTLLSRNDLELYNKVIKMPINVFAGVITTAEEQIYEQELDEYMEQLKEDIRELMKKPNEIAD